MSDKPKKFHQGVVVRLYPTEEQKVLFEKNCGCARLIYNQALRASKAHYELTGKRHTNSYLSGELPDLKVKHPYLYEVDSTSLQQALKNLEKGYQNAYRRLKKGEKAGFPRFKKKGVHDSFKCVMGLKLEGNHLKIGKHGWIKFRGNEHRLEGKSFSSITVSKDADKWYASCLIEVPEFVPHIHKYHSVGIDVGVAIPLTLAFQDLEGNLVHKEIGHFFSKELAKKEKRRERYQRAYSRKAKGSNNQQKAKLKVQRAFQKERNYRKNFIEQTSFKLATLFETIKVEDLKLSNMTRQVRKNEEGTPRKSVAAKSGLNRQLLRIGFKKLITRAQQKSTPRGGQLLKIDPKFTSQTCSVCGYTDKANRKSQAEFECLDCGFETNADYNAATNILARRAGLVRVREGLIQYK